MLRANGGGAAAAAVSGGKKKKPNRENAYMLFSKVVREDMYQKFGGLQGFNEHFATHYQNGQDEGRIKIPPVKMAVIGNMWSEAPPGVKAFFERAAERKNAWDDAKGLAEANADSDEDIPIGRTRPQGGGKARKIDYKNASAAGGSAGPAKEGARSLTVDARVDFEAQEKPGGKGTQVKQAAKKSTPMEAVDNRMFGTRREGSGRSESKDDPVTPNAPAAKMGMMGTVETGKRESSALESLPIAPDPAVSSDASSKTSTGVAKGVDQAATLSAKNEAKRRDSGERIDAAGEKKSAAGVPRDGKASERNVQGVGPKGRDKGKASGEGKQAEEEENVANAKGETRLPSTGVSGGTKNGERERDDGAVGKGKEKRASSESGGNRQRATVATNAKGETRLPSAGVSGGAKSGERERDDGAVGKGKEKRASSESGGNRQNATAAANAKGETRLPSAGVSEGTKSGERERDDGAVGKGKEKRASSESGGNRQRATVAANTTGTGKPNDIGASGGADKAGAVGRGGGEEKTAKDDRKSNSAGHGTSAGNTTHKNDKRETTSSLGKIRGDLSASTGGKVKSDRREHGGESGGGEKTNGSEEKRGEMAVASEVFNAEERSRDKGKGKVKTKSAEKRKSIAEGKVIKGAGTGTPGVGKVSSGSSATKPRANPTDEAKVVKDPRRAPATREPQRKEARSTNLDSRSSVTMNSTKRKEARQQASTVPITSRGRRGVKEAAANTETSEKSTGAPKVLTSFGLERGERVAIEVEWPVEVQKGGRKTEERLEWFSATVDLHKQLRADEEGRPKWIIHYARHGSLPASKSKVTFLGDDMLMDDYEDDPLRWRKKGSTLPTSEADSSPRRAGSAGGSSVGSSADHEVEWRDDFGLKPRRRS